MKTTLKNLGNRMIEDLARMFDMLDCFTISDYVNWLKRESSERAWFTPVSKTEVEPVEVSKYLEWAHQEGIITEMGELPVEVNPYAKENIHILYKKEYTNPTGSGKDRPASFMLYFYNKLGLLNGKDRITIAGAGNFARSVGVYVKKIAPHIRTVESRMGYVAIERNPDLIAELEREGVKIIGCEDTQCPSILSENDKLVERGKAITDSWMEEAINPTTTVFLDQHGYWKPFDAVLNPAAYYHTLGPEIEHQVKKLFGDVQFEYCQGMGTRGSLMGVAVRLLKNDSRTKILGHIPKTDELNENKPTFQFGLRKRKELGKAYTLSLVDKLCERVYETSDREVAKIYVDLLENEIPGGPSFAGNVKACLMRAEELHKKCKEGIIVTLAFDGPNLYRRFLEQTLPQFGYSFHRYSNEFENVSSIAEKERSYHLTNLRLI